MYKSSDLDFLKNVGARIKAFRAEKNITLKDLAYTINMEPPNLSVIENGKSNP
ncbi:MAG: Helix-turn-helix domain [Bacteroidota bacterium]|jgi:transcriptional regulator with XRE-family HTH domain